MEAIPQQDLMLKSFSSNGLGLQATQGESEQSDCETDPDMPDLEPAPCSRHPESPLGSACSRTTLLGTPDAPECEVESPGLNTWRERRGGLDSCWGSSALKNALTTMDAVDGEGLAELRESADGERTPTPTKSLQGFNEDGARA